MTHNTIILTAWIAALGSITSACDAGHVAAATAPDPLAKDALHLEPGNPRLKFVKVETVTETTNAPGLSLTGHVAFDEEHTQRVASPIDGRAIKILAKPGDKVKPGQALLELSSPHVGEIQAEAQKSVQDLDVSQKAIGRAHKLMEDGAISDKEVAQIEADYRKAKAEAARATAQLQSLTLSPTDPGVTAALRAQIAGTVVDRNVLVGQEVRADGATPLFTLSDLSTVWVLADVYEQDLAVVHGGDPVGVRVAAYPGEVFEGTVAHVGEVVDPASRTVKLGCVLSNPDGRLKPEMFAQVELRGAVDQSMIIIPSKAVITDSEHARVLVAGQDDVYRSRVIDIGPEVDGKVRVLRGLAAGERIVTDGAIFLNRDLSGS